MTNKHLAAILAFATITGCSSPPQYAVGDIEFSGPSHSGEPHLVATEDGRALLTWLEKVEGRTHALKMAERVNGVWSEPKLVVEGDRFFVNWADFPSILELADGRWIVHWLEKSSQATYAYHVKLAVSGDRGETWSDPFSPHRDVSPTEHGFVSMVPWAGGAAVIWLDGRQMDERYTRSEDVGSGGAGDRGAMSIRFTTLSADGSLGEDALIDGRACECCATALTAATSGLVAAYRDRSDAEIRDVAVVRLVDGSWTEPRHVGSDNWYYPGCPVNGPQLSAAGDTVVVAWFSAPEQRPRVQVAFSTDGGATFGEPLRVDDGRPRGRVDIEFLPDGAAMVIWLELTEEGAEIRGRRVVSSGVMDDSWPIAQTTEARASGFPRMARVGDELLFAWTLVGDDGGIRVAAARRGD